MTFADLKTELMARGFDYLSATRQGYFLNRSYQEICEQEDWPFLEATTSGTAPLTITDVRTVEWVINTTQLLKLSPLDRRHITDADADTTTTGTPTTYYLSGGNTVNVYPANTTDSFAVRYWKVPDDLSADADVPLVPARFQQVIVDGACAYAYYDSDNFDAATQMLALRDQGIDRMRESLLVQQHDLTDDYVVLTSADDLGSWGW